MKRGFFVSVVLTVHVLSGAYAQTLQHGIDPNAKGSNRVRVEYVGYRAASWETEKLIEEGDERVNRGGIVTVYLRNASDKPVRFAFWRCNGKDESHWRLGGFLSWDRTLNEHLEPGELTVCEINAVSEEFGPGKPFKFSYVERGGWMPACRCDAVLNEDPVQIALIRFLPGMKEIEVHLRNTGGEKVTVETLEVFGKTSAPAVFSCAEMDGPSNAIGRIALEQPLAAGDVTYVKATVTCGDARRSVFSHRRAHEDWFPIGVWSNNERTYETLARTHVDLVVRGGRCDDAFYSSVVPKYGFRTIAPCGISVDVDTVRDLAKHPAVACWMLTDEPDWSVAANVMAFADSTLRGYDKSKPSFLTLCRNCKFFEYGPIADIPCMDHYCVTAPTSSKWPHLYGTRLEETGFYTRDLKRAAEPKPIWVWSQAIATWGERPKRTVPTPNELAVQLVQNIGRGAKGIIWFNYDEDAAAKYPDAVKAMAEWGRVMRATRADFLGAEGYAAGIAAPEKCDAVALASRDKVMVCLTNADYDIHPEAYPFRPIAGVEISLKLPAWIEPKCAYEVAPDGVRSVEYKAEGRAITLKAGDIEACKIIVIANDPAAEKVAADTYAKASADETKAF